MVTSKTIRHKDPQSPIADVDLPSTMRAQVIRSERMGDPATAFQIEEVPMPTPGRGEVLVQVMAAGVNFNNVWAAQGVPIDVIAQRQRAGSPWDFHVGGTDASGIVVAVGEGADGDLLGTEVVVAPGWWNDQDSWIQRGRDPMVAPSARIWGYDADNFGAFGEYAIAQEHQILPKAQHLTWEEAASPTLVGATAYRMLFGWAENELRKDQVVLVWGGSGGLGGQAIQLATSRGALPVAVVSDPDRGAYCERLGAVGWINRREFSHWGVPPLWDDEAGQSEWLAEARRFGRAIWDVLGAKRSPAIVFEHPGQDSTPTSIFVCEEGGMVVTCAGTSGYSAMVDVRYLWVRQKRFQGSHGANDEQSRAYNDLVRSGKIDPCMGRVVAFDELGKAHAEMAAGTAPPGNTAVLVGAPGPGLGRQE